MSIVELSTKGGTMYVCDICKKDILMEVAKDECSFYWSNEDGTKRCRVRCFFHHYNEKNEECHGGVCPDCQGKIFREALNLKEDIWFVVGKSGIANLIALRSEYTNDEIKVLRNEHEKNHPSCGKKYTCKTCSSKMRQIERQEDTTVNSVIIKKV